MQKRVENLKTSRTSQPFLNSHLFFWHLLVFSSFLVPRISIKDEEVDPSQVWTALGRISSVIGHNQLHHRHSFDSGHIECRYLRAHCVSRMGSPEALGLWSLQISVVSEPVWHDHGPCDFWEDSALFGNLYLVWYLIYLADSEIYSESLPHVVTHQHWELQVNRATWNAAQQVEHSNRPQ